MSTPPNYDYIIVGAGPAGCVMAARLCEDPEVRVLLVESGGSDRGQLFLAMPLALPFVYQNNRIKWGHCSGPEPHLHGKIIQEQGGRIVGGSSSIDSMIFNRGNPLDYDGRAEKDGLTGWSWSHVLPYFQKLETFSDGADQWRGGDGPFLVSRAQAKHKLFDAFLTAGEQAGYDVTPDHNGYRQEGMHLAQVNIHHGERWSAARAYLRPAQGRDNLTLMTRSTINRVLVTDGLTTGIEVEHNGEVRPLTATREVILCAGAMNTPKLLLLSGIGPADQLTRHGIPLVAEAPEVGKNLQNHPGVDVQFATDSADSQTSEISLLKRPVFGSQWLLTRRGLGASNLFEAGAFLKTREDADYVNMQYEFLPLCRHNVNGKVVPVPGFQVWMDLSRPESRGEVTLTSADPTAPVSTVFNTYDCRSDLTDIIAGVTLLRETIATQPALMRFKPTELNPGPGITRNSTEEMEEWVRQSTGTSYHASSTCRMGVNAASVVDPEGRVRAVEGLRVADASILPRTVTANLQAAVLMVAEKIADHTRGRSLLPVSTAPFHRS